MEIEKKILQQQCRELWINYEGILRGVAKDEIRKINESNPLANTIEEIAIQAITSAGMKKGMDLLINSIYKLSQNE